MSVSRTTEENTPPTISVVIPCYNAESFLEETIRSVAKQTLAPEEILVVDDGSTDRSREIAVAADSLVRVISQDHQGVSVARNRGFEEAQGEWIAFLDADDLWEPTKLEEQLKLTADDVVCIHTAYYRFGAGRGIVNRANVPPAKRYSVDYLAVNGVLLPSSLLIRKSVRTRFPQGIKQAEDMLFSLSICHEGRVRMVPKPLVGYRVHAASATSRDDVRILWHKSILGWLPESGVDVAIERRIRSDWNDRLIVSAGILLLLGRAVQSRVLFRYLRSLRIGLAGWIAAPFRYYGKRWRYLFHPLQTG